MRRFVFGSAVAGWLVGLALLAIHFNGGLLGAALDSSSSPASAGSQGASVATFSESQALARAEQLAGERLAQSIGRAQVASDGTSHGPLQVDGHVVSIPDLKLQSIRLSKGAQTVTTERGNVYSVGGQDVWVASWEREGIPIPAWGSPAGRVRVEVVFEDGSGKLMSADVGKVNLNPPK